MAKKKEAPKTQIFVYGTLRRGHCNHGALVSSTFVGPAFLQGQFRCVELGWFPGVQRTEKEQSTIYGELYEDINMETLEYIDTIEGHPSFYERRRLVVRTPEGKRKAWVYIHPGVDAAKEDICEKGWRLSDEEEQIYDQFVAE